MRQTLPHAAILAAALMLGACASAQMQAPASAPLSPTSPATTLPLEAGVSVNPADAPAGAYELDPRHASVIWRVRHNGLGVYVGRFDAISGALSFDPANPANSALDVTIAAASASTGLRNREGALAFDAEIAEVLGAQAHPDITFESTSITLTGPASGSIAGELTLNGQTHPATLEAAFHGGRFVQLRGSHVLAFAARAVIDRSQWGAGSLIFDRFAGNEVEIVIEAEFVKS